MFIRNTQTGLYNIVLQQIKAPNVLNVTYCCYLSWEYMAPNLCLYSTEVTCIHCKLQAMGTIWCCYRIGLVGRFVSLTFRTDIQFTTSGAGSISKVGAQIPAQSAGKFFTVPPTFLWCLPPWCIEYFCCWASAMRYAMQDKKLIRRWDSERELSLRRHCTRTKNTIDTCINTATDRFLQRRFTKFSEIT